MEIGEMLYEVTLSPAHLQSNFDTKGWVHYPKPKWSVITPFKRTDRVWGLPDHLEPALGLPACELAFRQMKSC